MTDIEKNVEIARWLGWKEFSIQHEGEDKIVFEKDSPTDRYYAEELDFCEDSNWQWICLEKITSLENCQISNVYQHLGHPWAFSSSKYDLFEAIFNYITEQ